MAQMFQLNEAHQADRHFQDGGERDPEAAIVGEIAVRLLEIAEVAGPTRATGLIQKLSALSLVSSEGFWATVRLMTGDLSELTTSYAELGKINGRSKQGEQQARLRALNAIKQHFPLIAAALVELRQTTAEIKAPG